jgi:hypothetical protein
LRKQFDAVATLQRIVTRKLERLSARHARVSFLKQRVFHDEYSRLLKCKRTDERRARLIGLRICEFGKCSRASTRIFSRRRRCAMMMEEIDRNRNMRAVLDE